MITVNSIAAWAESQHRNTNHTYGEFPYAIHLFHVLRIAQEFIHLIPESKYPVTRREIYAAALCHDLIEDCRISYADLVVKTNTNVADIVYAVTNEKGKTRKERANAKYYAGIKAQPGALFVKLCDRIANVEHGIVRLTVFEEHTNSMFNKYCEEQKEFEAALWDDRYSQMFGRLRTVLGK